MTSSFTLCGSLVKSVYAFETSLENELPLHVGDIVLVDEEIDKHWAHGRRLRDGASGRFPASFVLKLDLPLTASTNDDILVFCATSAFSAQQGGDLGFDKDAIIFGKRAVDENWWEGSDLNGHNGIFPIHFVREVMRLPAATQAEKAVKARVKTSLKAQLPDEIDLHEGEDVWILEFIDKAWCRGRTADGRTGTFPRGFVVLDEEPSTQRSTPHQPISNGRNQNQPISNGRNQNQPIGDGRNQPIGDVQKDYRPMNDIRKNNRSMDEPQQNRSMLDTQSRIGDIVRPYGRTKYPFEGEFSGELSFSAGQIVYLRRRIDGDWLEGEIDGRVGMFPRNYVDTISDLPLEEESRYPEDSRLVLFDFLARERGDLNCRAGDRVRILRRINGSDWFEAVNLVTGARGIIPTGFVDADGLPVMMRVQNDRRDAMARQAMSVDFGYAGSSTEVDEQARRATVELESVTLPTVPQLHRTQHKKSAPPRPTPPQRQLSFPLQSEDVPSPVQNFPEKRRNIIREMLQSEQDYISALSTLREVFGDATTPSSILQKKNVRLHLIVDDYPDLIELAKELLQQLQFQAAREQEKQELGAPFVALADRYRVVYARFCEHFEQVQTSIQKNSSDVGVSNALNDCARKLHLRAACFDLSSGLSRPIQRVMKYPLFIGELLKATHDNHPDRVRLAEALKLMTDAAQAVNETKRRKDLVMKYRKPLGNETSVTNRLSRLNMHSVLKKSSRFSQRLSSSLGITHVTRDERFEQLEHEFRNCESSAKAFLRNVHAYCEQLQHAVCQWESFAEALLELYGTTSGAEKVRNFHSCWSGEIRRKLMAALFSTISTKINAPLEQLVQLFGGPDKLVAKRADKLLDFDATSARAEKVRSGGDEVKMKIVNDELRLAQANYEALNSQLLAELPPLLRAAWSTLSALSRSFVVAQQRFFRDLRQTLSPLSRYLPPFAQSMTSSLASVSSPQTLGEFAKRLNSASTHLSKGVTFAAPLAGVPPPQIEKSPAVHRSSKMLVEKKAPIEFPQRAQNEKDRELLRGKYAPTKLFIVNAECAGDDELDLSANAGELVAVIVDKDPMGKSDRWFVDNGVSKGFICRSVLEPATALPTSTPRRSDSQDIEQSLIDLSSPTTKQPSGSHLGDLLDLNFAATSSYDAQAASMPTPMCTHPIQRVYQNLRPQLVAQTPPPAMVEPVVYRQPIMTQPGVARAPIVWNQPVVTQPVRPMTVTQPAQPIAEYVTKSPVQPVTERQMTEPEPAVHQLPIALRMPQRPAPEIPKTASSMTSHQPQRYERVEAKVQQKEHMTLVRESAGDEPQVPQRPLYENVAAPEEPRVIAPVRPAPPPPLPAAAASSQQHRKDEATPTREADTTVEFYVANYEYTASAENELSVTEGQVVAVLLRHDLEGNADWWFVEDDGGQQGFVPANYLSPYGDD